MILIYLILDLGSLVHPLSETDFFALPMLTTSLNSSVCVWVSYNHTFAPGKATKQHFVGALLALEMAHIHHAT